MPKELGADREAGGAERQRVPPEGPAPAGAGGRGAGSRGGATAPQGRPRPVRLPGGERPPPLTARSAGGQLP